MIRYRLQFSKQAREPGPFHPDPNALQCSDESTAEAGGPGTPVGRDGVTPRQPARAPAKAAVDSVSSAVALKGRMMMVSVMRIATADREALDHALAQRFSEAPELLRDMPMVLDLEAVSFASLADAMIVIEHVRRQGYKLIGLRRAPGLSPELVEASGLPEIVVDASTPTRPAGVPRTSTPDAAGEPAAVAVEVEPSAAGNAGVSDESASVESAEAEAVDGTGAAAEAEAVDGTGAGIGSGDSREIEREAGGIDGEAGPESGGVDGGAKSAAPSENAARADTTTRLVLDHVRSGQQVYARGGDLIVVGTVSAGAEVLADGHIIVHGSLRGRALAGVRGMTDATIYCRRLDAELLAIAGNYRVAEDIGDSERGENRLVTLAGERLQIRET